MRAWMGRSFTSLLVSVKFFVLIQLLIAANLFFDIEWLWGVVLVSMCLAFAADVIARMKNARARRAVVFGGPAGVTRTGGGARPPPRG